MASTFSKLSYATKARDILEHAKAINPKAAYFHCGRTLREPFHATRWLGTGSDRHVIFAGNAAVAQPLITALLEARRFAEAMAVADRLAADPKQRATALVYRGNILLAQRNLTEAKAAFDGPVRAVVCGETFEVSRTR